MDRIVHILDPGLQRIVDLVVMLNPDGSTFKSQLSQIIHDGGVEVIEERVSGVGVGSEQINGMVRRRETEEVIHL